MKKVLNICNRIGLWTSGAALLLMMALTAADVCGRYLFKRPITGTADLTELMMVLVVFLALSDTASSGSHISVQVVVSQLSTRKQQILKSITSFFSSIIVAVVAWRVGVNAVYTFKYPENTLVLDISKAPFMSLAAVGCAMLSVALFVIFCDALSQSLKKTNGDGSEG